ncbi:MAG: methionyl-tRNA formyltransferase [Candidatus Syntrophonatronum acetioxidans]|uniref:Methionyl-tRNA formyltransferase n=1 Tax=Candidatus Syntrophonatronum acetioxidans TaxID=1795816 RepID=A0A424YHS4_9FIRM|nr:MAG: methionyl-tRNA formyltransferase [Candidatus Syntrophonatronum acetioxidans]
MKSDVNLIFMGTPEFALPSLRALLKEGYQVKAVVTQPDRPSGRGGKIKVSPVKEEALIHGLEVLQPSSLDRDFIDKMRHIKPDILVVVAYGKILPPDLLNIPPLGCINLHASLLPRYRGAAPIHRAVINGEKITGVTTMYMKEGMDTGDIILQEEARIDEKETAGSLHDRLAEKGAKLLIKTLELIQEGKAPSILQEEEKASYAPPLKREEELIDWRKSAAGIFNKVRGMNPWPGAYTCWKGKRLKVWNSRVVDQKALYNPGEIIRVDKEGILVGTGKGTLLITRVQISGGRKMKAGEFIRGKDMKAGELLEGW